MKTTVEIPDSLARRVKAAAAMHGQPMRDFFIEALAEKLQSVDNRAAAKPAWMKFAGKAPRGSLKSINKVIAEEFSTIDRSEWQ